MANTVFVTGGSGFVGRNLIAALRDRGYRVRALARSQRAAETVRRIGAEPVMGDLQDDHALRAGMRGSKFVFHVAADTRPWGDYDEAFKINVVGTERVLEAAHAAGVSRLVYASSEAVLIGADQRNLVNVDETWPRPKDPIGRYNGTKAAAEIKVLVANSAHLETVVVRPRLIGEPAIPVCGCRH